jgi:uncharacterized protein (DUF2252 family)
MLSVDPNALARHQLALDAEKMGRFAHKLRLLDRKIARMTLSPLALLRGAAPLFYDLLAAHPSLAEGPRGKGWLVGDLHLENFGAYRLGPAKRKHDDDEVTFDLNDFDDALVGPWRFDVLRLVTSLILGGRELGASGARALDLAHRLLDAYVASAFHDAPLPRAPDCVARLVERVTTRTRAELLDARTEETKHGERRFARDGARYYDLPASIAERAPGAFARYAAALTDAPRLDEGALDVLDVAWRVAGCGSLGGLRVAVLVRGKGGADGAWIFDMKEEGMPSAAASRMVRRPAKALRAEPAARVCAGFRASVPRAPRWIGTTWLGDRSMFVRRLAPQEDKLDLETLRDVDLDPLASYLGALTGRAHARGATKTPRDPWTEEERAGIVDRAIAIAGIHEATYLALCKIARARATA